MKDEITQMHFDFKDWQDAFETWERSVPIYGDDMQLVISTHPYTSGYWIEAKGKGLTQGDFVYVGEEVAKLKSRIIKEMELAKSKCTQPRFTV